jgi:hypothetical protein
MREQEVLRRLARHRFLSRSQIEAFLFDGASLGPGSKDVLTRRVLGRLTTRGLVSATRRLVGGPGGGSARLGYALTEDGARLAGGAVRAARRRSRGTFLLAHSLMAADVALAFGRSAQSNAGHELADWESYEQGAALLWSGLVPDARLAYTTPAWRLDAFVEVDLATEGTRFFSAKIGRYVDLYRSGTWRAQLPTWPAVLTITPTLRRASALRVATEGVLASSAEWMERATKFAFAPLDEVLGGCGPLGAIWQVAGREGLQRLIPEDGNKAPGFHE